MITFHKAILLFPFIVINCIAVDDSTLCDSLYLAAAFGKIDRIQEYLSNGVDINCKSRYKSTALHQSAGRLYTFEATRYLVEHGADVNAIDSYGMTPLQHAASNKEFTTIRYLVAHGAKQQLGCGEETTPLCRAIEADSNDLAKFLIANGANVNPKLTCKEYSPLCIAVEKENYYMVNYLIERRADVNLGSNYDQALNIAVCHKSLPIVRLLLRNSADVTYADRYGKTVLHRAAEYGSFEYVKALVEHGADMNALDSNKALPLHYAAAKSNPELVDYFLSGSAKLVNAVDKNGNAPLHYLLSNCHKMECPECHLRRIVSTINLLISNGADINARNSEGNTPLHLAMINANGQYSYTDFFLAELVHSLMTLGADVSLLNNKGQSAYWLAQTNGYNQTQLALKESGHDFSADDRSIALLKKNELRERRHDFITKKLPGPLMAIGIPLTYLGLSVYAREGYYQNRKGDNPVNPVNYFATSTCCGTAIGVLIGLMLEPPRPTQVMSAGGEGMITVLSGLAGTLVGGMTGLFVALKKHDSSFLYYGAPIGISFAFPLFYFATK